jgi:3-deoxy-manno-octulosonate cytidylyltransferase (CMP-KDO synthetase)
VGTLVKRINRTDELESPNTAKVVLDERGYALYFSRNPIPFCREETKLSNWIQSRIYYKHVGIYSYRKSFLLQFSDWEPTLLETIEKLEQLRVLEKGFRIKTAETPFEAVCVDTPEDAEKVRHLLKNRHDF